MHERLSQRQRIESYGGEGEEEAAAALWGF